MRAAPSHDVLVVFLWLGLAVLLITRLDAAPRPASALRLEMPAASRDVEAERRQELADGPMLRTVSLPPPPKIHLAQPAAETTEPPPPTAVRALKAQPKAAPDDDPKRLTPLRPVKTLRPDDAAAEEPAATAERASPLQEAAPTIEPAMSSPEGAETPQGKGEAERAPETLGSGAPQDSAPKVTPGALEAQEGRTLLRLLEHGSGPEIELAWPESQSERLRLHQRLQNCFGMRVAAMDSAGRLYRWEGRALAPWSPNMDLYSGFLRSPSGRLTAEEESLLQSARRRLPSASPVRLFTRRVDALLLGGLQSVIGPGYTTLRTIHGRYRLSAGRVLIERVEGDGRRFPGTIDLTPAAAGRCGDVTP